MLQRKKPLASKGRTFAKRYDAFEYERDDIYNHIVPEEVEIAGTKIVSLASLMPQQDSSNGSSSNSGSSSSKRTRVFCLGDDDREHQHPPHGRYIQSGCPSRVKRAALRPLTAIRPGCKA